MISQSTIDKIMDAAEIVDVVSDYVTLRRAGASYKGLCPFHDDTTPSFSVSPARGLCKCFSCGKGGNSVHFIMEMEQIGYLDAIRFLGKKYGIQVEEEQLTDEQRQSLNERESMFAVNEWAAKYFNETMLNNADGRAIGLAYFRSRGFRDDIIHKFKLGFCLDSFDAMLKAAKAKGYKEKYLADTGLCVKRDNGTYYDRFRGRAMFPWFNISGKVVAFGGRVLDSRTKGVSQKYVNSPDSAIYHKARELYGIYQAKKMIAKEDVVYMVEGYTDVLSMHQCGIENVVANSGTALNEAQIHLLHRRYDAGVQQPLLVGAVLATELDNVLDLKGELQHVFQFLTEIVIGLLHRIGALLEPDKVGQGVQGQNALAHGYEEQIRDLIPAVLLLDRVADEPLLDIVADHGGGQSKFLQRGQVAADVLGCLLQVQSYVGDLLIAGKPEVLNGRCKGLGVFLFHHDHLGLLYRKKRRMSTGKTYLKIFLTSCKDADTIESVIENPMNRELMRDCHEL